ncbi:MAG: tRNA (adenosine(37)-N6)-threonylcarbamoyltransferase complex ATPase subunit type 1 TsaE [Lachnospiraceae bacterium]|nr:tRNA (adenosine(37)-N6)-threonylcarbamoyltransferase complex ATPase subunit type 1 TsaE [Lachnospiraceae bacterium]
MDFAGRMAGRALPGWIIGFTGELGCGKTVFAKGFAKGLGIDERVNSPTFTILHSYESGRMPFHHFDVYRIEEPEEMEEIGYEDCFFSDGVTLVEWAELIKDIMPEETIWIKVTKNPEKGYDYRLFEISGYEE